MPGTADRIERLASWNAPVTSVRLVDETRAEALGKLGVNDVEQLLRHYPFRYLDLTATASMDKLRVGQDVTVVGKVHAVTVKRPRHNLSITEVALVDGTGVLIGVWFNASWIARQFKEGDRVAFSGRVEISYGMRQMKTPVYEKLSADETAEDAARIIPIHRATAALSANWVRRLVREALDASGDVPDFLPAELRLRRGSPPLADALAQVHFPESIPRAEEARRRFAYEELLTLQLGLAMRRHALTRGLAGFEHATSGPHLAKLRASLPFELTGDQQRATGEILADMAAPHPMNRMLLGDVGTGKTAVAALAMAASADSGGQAAMMAPTEVLATQYARAVGSLLDPAGIPWALLTGGTPATEARRVREGVADGSVTVLLGTHALVQDSVAFAHLTLAIVDEQHRFGVSQRLGLRAKGETADLLVMTATPIPRSLALTLYGDLDTRLLKERPGGRDLASHVETAVVHASQRDEAYERVRSEVAAGRQAYVVCPLVDESDETEAKAATAEAGRLRKTVFPDLRVGLLTGQMKPAEKAAAMEAFRAREADVLVATTVIEVGVDVPNATVMIVEDAERFGLAQLHQLRGRIGRGEHPGAFLLFADPKTDEGRRRMAAIATVSDGFALAEADLELRGEGQVLGERQHGLPELRLASVTRDADLLSQAREDAREIVEGDPSLERPEHGPLLREVRRRFAEAWEWVSAG
ncbi:MAG TPA: ATP-dependent DNA helicase RecG [Coriobacteriia bacterium]|jgi:ATP-dependent DNA helicase RecG